MAHKKVTIRHNTFWLLAGLTITITIAVLCGAPISPWWILAPFGIPLACMLFVPLYIVLGVVLLALIFIALVVIGAIPCLVLALLIHIKEVLDEDFILN